MRGYSELRIFQESEVRLWWMATRAVSSLPEDVDCTRRCHELARAVSVYLQSERPTTRVVDGKFGLADHSWLELQTGTARRVILDVYSVGSLPMVQLLDVSSTALLGARRYIEGTPRDDIDEHIVHHLVTTLSKASVAKTEAPGRSGSSHLQR